MDKYDVVIVGGGPAGLFAAVNIKDKSVLLIEKNEKLGKKLLVSGSGQCNFTHEGDIRSFFDHFGDHGKFTRTALSKFNNEDVKSYFNSQGVTSVVTEEGKVFPKEMDAQVVLDGLVAGVGDNVTLATGESVKTVQRLEEGFQIITDKRMIVSDYLVLATGGKSYPQLGCTGDGYTIAGQLGHSITPLLPGLCPVKVKNFTLKDLMGIAFRDVDMAHFRENKKFKGYTGDLLITHFGISGPIVLNNARHFRVGDQLKINFLTGYNRQTLDRFLMERSAADGKGLVKKTLYGFDLPKRFVDSLLKLAGITPDTTHGQLTKVMRKTLTGLLTEFSIDIETIGDYRISMATAGGVDIKEINGKTMASKVVPNLFVIGELMDVDGDTGGYNIQWALSSGYLAAMTINNI